MNCYVVKTLKAKTKKIIIKRPKKREGIIRTFLITHLKIAFYFKKVKKSFLIFQKLFLKTYKIKYILKYVIGHNLIIRQKKTQGAGK